MLKKMSTIFLVVLLVGLTFGQNIPAKKAPVISDESTLQVQRPASVTPAVVNTPKSPVTWVFVDSMANNLGPAIGTINPLAYDPYSKTVAVIHRAAGAALGGSGALFYNISTDQGVTWTRVSGPLNQGTQSPLRGRYPSMAISNGGKTADRSQVIGAFTWPALDNAGSGFDLLGFGADQPIGGGATYAGIRDDDGKYSSQTPVWAGDGNNWVYWTAEYSDTVPGQSNRQGRFFRTEDFTTIDTLEPAWLADPDTIINGYIIGGGAESGNTMYIGFLVGYLDTVGLPGPTMKGIWYPGVVKSTDHGATWGDVELIDFRKIPALAKYDRLFDYKKGDGNTISYGCDITVDKLGYPHLVTAVTDTFTTGPGLVDGNHGTNAVVELYKTASGWSGQVIQEGINDTIYTIYGGPQTDPGIGQCGPMPLIATDASHSIFVAQWVNGPTVTDTICDIFVSARTINGTWSKPVNITNTPLRNENCAHLAPFIEKIDDLNYRAFSFYDYEKDNNTYVTVSTNITHFWCASVPVQLVGMNDASITANSFNLMQNYPNPFNPATMISFNLNKGGNVSLRVFNILGQEVATLINGEMAAGPHQIRFDGSSLASGMYIYRLETADQIAVKKMTLIK